MNYVLSEAGIIMDKIKKNKLELCIKEKIESVKKDIEAYTELAKPVSPDNAIGRITRMEAINSKSINEASLNMAKGTLKRLENALKEIDDPDFGYCYECEESIAFARLMILPESVYCVKCAEKNR